MGMQTARLARCLLIHYRLFVSAFLSFVLCLTLIHQIVSEEYQEGKMLYPPDIMHLIFFSKLLSIHKFEPIITKKMEKCQNMLHIALFSACFVSIPDIFSH